MKANVLHLKCSGCDHRILFPSAKERKRTIMAAKTNGHGPFCYVCQNLWYAVAAAHLRRLPITLAQLNRIRMLITK